jgi:hypothetical protein
MSLIHPDYLAEKGGWFSILHEDTKRAFRGKRGRKSRFGHMFGGSADYAGLRMKQQEPPVHLLFRLNTEDEAVGSRGIEAKWLPLLCAIRYGACEMAYRVLSDEKVKILHRHDKVWDGFPYDGFPDVLPAKPVSLRDTYDPQDLKDVYWHATVFGYDSLSPKKFAELARRVERNFGLERGAGKSHLETFSYSEFFVQGKPSNPCPEPKCSNRRHKGSMRILATFEEDSNKSASLWGPSCENLQIIWLICPKCSAIFVTNQCT